MCIEEVKKQIVMVHQAITELAHDDRLESIRFLCECCDDLRLMYPAYEDIDCGQVLNLTTSHKLPDCVSFDDRILSRHFNVDDFNDAHDVDFGCEPLPDPPPEYQTLGENRVNWQQPIVPQTSSDPVNLVLKPKQNAKKNRRKQMFTKKSIRKLSERGKELRAKSGVKCVGCDVICQTETLLIQHLHSHEPTSLSCRLCRSQFSSLYIFWKHKKDGKCQIKSRLICPDCGDSFKVESNLVKHLQGHKLNNCKHCDKKFSCRAKCRDHMKKSHPDIKLEKESIPCKFCPMSFPRLQRLYNHYKLHHSKGKFVCTACGLFLSTKEKHKEHMVEHEKEKKWQCNVCTRKFYSKNMLTNHVKIHESGAYQCLTCKMSVASKAELVEHKRRKHEVRGLEPKFECETCHKMFPKKSALERHHVAHLNGPDAHRFSCHHCDKTFNSLDSLLKHKKRKTHLTTANVVLPESKYEKVYEDQLICENCGKQYQTYTQLMYHLRTHKTTYSCDKCHKTFNMKVNLRRHMKLHEGKRSAICELCGDSFARLDSLREHRLIKHSDARPLTCPFCPKTFKRNSELNRHKRVHDSARPYVCYCGLDYKQAAHLRSHQKKKGGANSHHHHSSDFIPEGSNRLEREGEKMDAIGAIDILDRDRVKPYPCTNEQGTLLSLENFEEQHFRLHDSFKVPYVAEDYGHMGYGDLQFGAPTAVSPAVDLSMVSISDVVCRDMDAGLSKPEIKETEPSSAIQLVNLSEHNLQEYLLNLP